MKVNNYFSVLIYLLLITPKLIFGQQQLYYNPAIKFDNAGVSEFTAPSVSGNEVIDDYYGNLNLVYSSDVHLPNSMGGNLTLTQNTNVQHRVFWSFHHDKEGFPVNSPEWIIGYKGFALQTFNFETNFFMKSDSGSLSNLQGEEVPRLIAGYHFCNMFKWYESAGEEVGGHVIQLNTNIKILKSDGSLLTLRNGGAIHTGRYYEDGMLNHGFADVNYYDTADKLREIKYYPGDGLEYYFVEEFVKYNGRDTFVQTDPKVAYLKEIRNTGGDTLFFHYDHHRLNTYEYGRKVFSYMSYNIPNGSFIYPSNPGGKEVFRVTFTTGDGQTFPAYCLETVAIEGGSHDYTGIFDYRGHVRNVFLHSDRLSYPEVSKILPLQSIRLSNDLVTTFDYGSIIYRNYEHEANNFDFSIPLYAIKEIQRPHGSKTTYSYKSSACTLWEFTDIVPGDLFVASNLSNLTTMQSIFRDDFSNLMISSKNEYLNSNLRKSYNYHYTWSNPDALYKAELTDINTTITIENHGTESYSDGQKQLIFKKYSQYRTTAGSELAGYFPEQIKIKSEKYYTNGSEKYKLKTYNYSIGNLISASSLQGLDGNFLLTSEQTKLNGTTISTTNNVTYINSLFEVIPNRYAFSERKVVDERQTSNITNYRNIFDNDGYVTFFLTNIKCESQIKNNTEIIEHIKYEHFSPDNPNPTDDDYLNMGKTKSITYNFHHNPVTDYFTYYNLFDTTNMHQFYRGLLKSAQINSKGTYTQQFNYPAPIYDEVKRKFYFNLQYAYCDIKDTSGVIHKDFYAYLDGCGWQIEPYQIVTNYNHNGTQMSDTIYSVYGPQGNLTLHIDKNKQLFTKEYDQLIRLSEVGIQGSFALSPLPNRFKFVKPVKEYTYDDENNIIYESFWPNFMLTDKIENKYEFNGFARLCTTSTKNNSGIYEIKNIKTYNYLGKVEKDESALGVKAYYKYDHLGRQIKQWVTAPVSGPEQSIEYDVVYDYDTNENVQITTSTDESNKTVASLFDEYGNVIKDIKYDGSNELTTQYNYDVFNRLTSIVSPEGLTTTYQYDEHSNVVQKTLPDVQGAIKYKYDKYGNLRFTYNTGADDYDEYAITFYSYDELNRHIGTGVMSYYYLTEVYDNGNIVSFDSLNPDFNYGFQIYPNLLISLNMYDEYDNSGFFQNMQTPANWHSSDHYFQGRLVATAYKHKVGAEFPWKYKLYDYDEAGRVKYYYTKLAYGSWSKFTYRYDNINNLKAEFVDYDFDSTNTNDTKDMIHFWYNYDEQNRLSEVWTSQDTARNYGLACHVKYYYNLDNQITTTSLNRSNTNYRYSLVSNYDNRGRITSLKHDDGGTCYYQDSLTYYLNSNIQFQYLNYPNFSNFNNISYTYSYDGYNRLTNANCSYSGYSESYTYDGDGNITGKGASDLSYNYQSNTNKLDNVVDLSTLDQFSFSYDYKGNVTTDNKSGTYNMTYNHQNLPMQVVKSGVTHNYQYDEQANRIYKSSTGVADYYLYDHLGKQIGVIDNSSKKLQFINIYGNGLLGRIDVSYTGIDSTRNDTCYYYLKDHLGSVHMTLDETGAVKSAQDYFPYGKLSRSYDNSDNNGIYKFTEKERDSETNYDYFGARYYNNDLGVWLQIDPLADKYPGWSPYNYVMGNPLRLIDPDGMRAVDPDPGDEGDPYRNATHPTRENTDIPIYEEVVEGTGYTYSNLADDVSETAAKTVDKSWEFTKEYGPVFASAVAISGLTVSSVGLAGFGTAMGIVIAGGKTIEGPNTENSVNLIASFFTGAISTFGADTGAKIAASIVQLGIDIAPFVAKDIKNSILKRNNRIVNDIRSGKLQLNASGGK